MVYSHLVGKDLVGAADVMERAYGARSAVGTAVPGPDLPAN
jgi:hypothetical protein